MANNIAMGSKTGIQFMGGGTGVLLNNSVLACKGTSLWIKTVSAVLALNNVLQSGKTNVEVKANGREIAMDYNIYASGPGTFTADGKALPDLAAWTAATGCDRNSTVVPVMYSKFRDPNGRWRIRPNLAQVSNMTHDFNVGPDSVNVPGCTGGTWVLDMPENWKAYDSRSMGVPPMSSTGVPPVKNQGQQKDGGRDARQTHGQDARATPPTDGRATTPGVYSFDHAAPNTGAVAAYAYWYVAKIDYLRKDATRVQADLVKIDLPPDQLPPGTFAQDAATGKLYVRLPSDAAVANPIGSHRKLAPKDAVGCYVGRQMPNEKYFNKLVTPELAAAMAAEGIKEVDAVENVLNCMCGTPGIEKGCPITGLSRDADNVARPQSSAGQAALGWYNGPGRFDIGSWERGAWVD
jgi:hypothetical protein